MANVAVARAHVNWNDVYAKHGSFLAQCELFLASYEQENQVTLSPGAVDVLFIPLVELLEAGEAVDIGQVTTTFTVLIGTMKNEPSNKDRKQARSSLSVIKAFWKNWCNIPPFCGETMGGSGTRKTL
jgi:hypothetical protein